jgi:hypothetical protein
MRTFLHRYRWVIFGLCSVLLIAAAFYSVHTSRSNSKVAGVLGPTPGPNSSGHISAQRAYLVRAANSDPTASSGALISLARMMRPGDAEAIRPKGNLTAIFVRFPASQPEAIKITTSITDAMNERATELQATVRAEIVGLTTELKNATGSQKTQIEQELAKRQSGLAQIKGDCVCVYALVVEDSTLADLEAEQNKPGVRLVDVPSPPVASLAGWQLTPILPAAHTA